MPQQISIKEKKGLYREIFDQKSRTSRSRRHSLAWETVFRVLVYLCEKDIFFLFNIGKKKDRP